MVWLMFMSSTIFVEFMLIRHPMNRRLDIELRTKNLRKNKNFPGKFVLQVEARDGLGSGPFTDNAEIVIDIQSINNHRPVITNPALTNSSVDIQGVSFCFALSFRSNLIDSFN